jgi:hypothetical protein
MSEFYVVTEDGDSLHVTAEDAQEAVDQAVNEWDLYADIGYAFKVFPAEAALPFEFIRQAGPSKPIEGDAA